MAKFLKTHLPDELLAQEIPDLDQSSSLTDGAVDGEMSIDRPHLVQVALGHAVDHVLDVRAHRPHGCQFLLATEPFLNLKY